MEVNWIQKSACVQIKWVNGTVCYMDVTLILPTRVHLPRRLGYFSAGMVPIAWDSNSKSFLTMSNHVQINIRKKHVQYIVMILKKAKRRKKERKLLVSHLHHSFFIFGFLSTNSLKVWNYKMAIQDRQMIQTLRSPCGQSFDQVLWIFLHRGCYSYGASIINDLFWLQARNRQGGVLSHRSTGQPQSTFLCSSN